MSVPSFGVGTFRLTGQTVIDSVRNALEVGYRAVDTAQIYGNEAEVGQAIAESGVPRDQLFLTTKIWVDNYAAEKLIPSLRDSLAKHQATVAQVALAWALQRGYSVIPSSTKRENLASNLLAQDLRLDADDMAAIAALDRNGREVDPPGLAPAWD